MDTSRRDFLTTSGAIAAQASTSVHHDDHEHQAVPSDLALRVKALESLLVDKGLVDPAALDAIVDYFEHKVGPRDGARVVARAWVDPRFKQLLLTNAPAAISELGYASIRGEHLTVLENSSKVQQFSSLHTVFLLPLGSSRASAGLVQIVGVSLTRGHRSARSAAGVWIRDSG
jgi:Nitrile hydratase, alpha chain